MSIYESELYKNVTALRIILEEDLAGKNTDTNTRKEIDLYISKITEEWNNYKKDNDLQEDKPINMKIKSKTELLKSQNDKENKQFQEYVKIMEEAIKNNYPNGLEIDELPYVERFIYWDDIEVSYYTGLDKKLIKAIEQTESFKIIAKELIDNGYKYELHSSVRHPDSRTEWQITIIIK